MSTPPPELQEHWRTAMHEAGLRVTPHRQALLAALWRQRHATAESLLAELAAADEGINLSTVYRGLQTLQGIGLVRHAHLGAGAPTYHIASESPHLHLQCMRCGGIISLPEPFAAGFVAQIADRTGFAADLTHAAIYGLCADCSVAG